MKIIVFKTENAVFEFSRKNVLEHLNLLATEHDGDETVRLLKLISTASGETIWIPNEHDYFGYVALDLIATGKGSVTCAACGKTYKAGQIKPTTVGHGRSPFDVKLPKKGVPKVYSEESKKCRQCLEVRDINAPTVTN